MPFGQARIHHFLMTTSYVLGPLLIVVWTPEVVGSKYLEGMSMIFGTGIFSFVWARAIIFPFSSPFPASVLTPMFTSPTGTFLIENVPSSPIEPAAEPPAL